MFKLLFALMGILLGVILAKIAPEELLPGKKYFVLLKRVIFALIILFVIYSLALNNKFIVLSIFVVIALTLLILDFKLRLKWLEVVNYLIFVFPYLLHTESIFRLISAVLIFLYGFPVGTLLMIKNKNPNRSKQ